MGNKYAVFEWSRLNDFMPKGVRVVDAWHIYTEKKLIKNQSFNDYMEEHYAEALLVYRTARRLLADGN